MSKKYGATINDVVRRNTYENKSISKPGSTPRVWSGKSARTKIMPSINKLLSNVRDRKDGHWKYFWGESGASKVSNKDWLKCFKAYHYRNCPDFDLAQAMKGCKYTQLEKDKDTSEYIIPDVFKSPNGDRAKRLFRQTYDDIYRLLKEDDHYSRMFPLNLENEIDCPKNLTKLSEGLTFETDEDGEIKERFHDVSRVYRGEPGPERKPTLSRVKNIRTPTRTTPSPIGYPIGDYGNQVRTALHDEAEGIRKKRTKKKRKVRKKTNSRTQRTRLKRGKRRRKTRHK